MCQTQKMSHKTTYVENYTCVTHQSLASTVRLDNQFSDWQVQVYCVVRKTENLRSHLAGIGDGPLLLYATSMTCHRVSIPVSDCMQMTLLCSYSTVKDVPDQLMLQDDLNKMARWAKTWYMIFNPSKCE